MKKTPYPLLFLVFLFWLGCTGEIPSISWEPVETGLQSSLRGLSVVDLQTVWISGTGGGVAHTRDGGTTWSVGTVQGSEALDFRDVEAFPDGTAYLMGAGNGSLSRVYKTTDWGDSWSLQHTNPLAEGFFNGMAFWDRENGVVVGDPIDGTLFLLATSDGGRSWERLTGPQIPRMMEGEEISGHPLVGLLQKSSPEAEIL